MYFKNPRLPLLCFALLFIAGSTFTFPNLGGRGLQLPFNNITWLFAALFVYLALLKIFREGSWQKPDIFPACLFLLLALALPLSWNETTDAGLWRMLALTLGLVFFTCLFSVFTRENEKNLLLIILLAGMVQATWGILQVFFLDISLPTGIFQQPNVMASFLVTTYLVSLLLSTPSYWTRDAKPGTLLYAMLLFAFVTGIIIFELNSRTAYLCLLLSLPLMVVSIKEKSGLFWILIAALVVGLCLAALKGNLFSIEQFGSRLYIGSADVSSGRWAIWGVCMEIIRDYPVRGIGYGFFEAVYHEYQAILHVEQGVNAASRTDHPHNELMLWSIEGGLLAISALVVFIVYQLYRIFLWGRSAYPYAALLLPLSIHAMLEYPFYHSALHFILFLCLLFILELHLGRQYSCAMKPNRYQQPICHFGVLAAMVFLLSNLLALQTAANYYAQQPKQRQLDQLLNIRNKTAIRRELDYAVLNDMLRRLRQKRDRSTLDTLVQFVDKMQARHPRPELYIALMQGYNLVNDKTSREKTRIKAHYYYPKDTRFQVKKEDLMH